MEDFVRFNRAKFIKDAEQLIYKHFPGVTIDHRKQYGNTITLIPKKDETSRCCPIAMKQHSKNNVYFCIDFFTKQINVKCFKPECRGIYSLNDETDLSEIVKENKSKRKANFRSLPDVPDKIRKIELNTISIPPDECFEMYTNLGFVYTKAKLFEKRPVFSGWTNFQKDDNEHFDCSKYNVAILTGEKSGIFVLDVDISDNGLDWFTKFCCANDYNPVAHTLTCRTPSGGLHLYYKFDKSILTNSVRMKTKDGTPVGLDIRSTDGCVIAPPSSYKNGSYAFVNVRPPQVCPDFITTLFTS